MRRGSIFWGALLIIVGVLFLLDNAGILNINIWTLFWPLLLIMAGLWILVSALGRKPAATERITLPLKGVERASVAIEYGAGQLVVNDETAPDELLDGSFGAGVEARTRARGETLEVRLKPSPESWWQWGSNRRWRIGLNRDIPLTLAVESGASGAHLDLTNLNLSELHLETGASETRVDLPALTAFTRVKVEAGAASVKLYVPEGVAARIQKEAGLASVEVDEGRFPRRGSGYESPDYDTAVHRLDLDISVGMGSVSVS